jgi:bifunctional non-homologous end joining protein LigD
MSRTWWPLPSGQAEVTDERRTLLEHYARVAPLIVESFGAIPLIVGMAPQGVGGADHSWVGPVEAKTLPQGVRTVHVPNENCGADYITASEATIEWLVRLGAVDFWSWTPVPGRPENAGYAHLWVGPGVGQPTTLMVRETCMTVRAVLAEFEIQGVLCRDGVDGYILLIPFGDAPRFADLDDWLFTVVYRASEREPELCSVMGDDSHSNLVQIRIDTNEQGWGVPLPYSIRARPGLPMVTPITWNEL